MARTPDEIIELAAWELWRADGSPDGVAKRDPYRKQARALAAAGFLDDPIRPAGLVRLRLVHDKLVLSWLHAEAVWRLHQARNQFLDHYNATSWNMDRIVQLETALRERTTERDLAVAQVPAENRTSLRARLTGGAR